MSEVAVLAPTVSTTQSAPPLLVYRGYQDESDLDLIAPLIEKDLSEPYSVFTYRLFVTPWPTLTELCFNEKNELVGCVVCKIDYHAKSNKKRGYIGMLAVEKPYRRQKVALRLVLTVLERMKNMGIEECVLEAEISNLAALQFYKNLGFIRTKKLSKYYLSNNDAYRLKKKLIP
jgi:N-alpha-acetyltransferase 30